MEWLQDEPPSAPLRRRRRLALTGVAVAVVLLIVGSVTVRHLQGDQDPQQLAHSPSPTRTDWRFTPTRGSAQPLPSHPPEPFLTDVDLDLFAIDDFNLYRLQTGPQTITAVPITGTNVNGPVGLVAGPDQVVVTNYDPDPTIAGNVVPDESPALPLPGLLADATQILPATDGELWVGVKEWGLPRFVRTDFAGREVPSGFPRSLLEGYTDLIGDGVGGLTVQRADAAYQLTPQGETLIARGTLIATGPHHFLFKNCTTNRGCAAFVYNRDTRQQRRLGPSHTGENASGTVSADGRYAAVRTWPVDDVQQFIVLDLRTGTIVTKVAEAATSHVDTSSLIWLPDDRLIYVSEGTLRVYDPATRRGTTPQTYLNGLTNVTLRG
ncbi:WD40 repeat domain-containing protein [Microlunatus ginsengisoli]|uniref:Uncharacterized protein n=1 Tax=Microlunatus ginsengisoli TaxID=363863 RepID=A0ABP6ZB10_9ACTN